jgi:hypothetical protein
MGLYELILLILLHVKNDKMIKIEFTISVYNQILNIICSKYKIISKILLIIWNVSFPGKIKNSNVTEVRLYATCRTPFVYAISIVL